MGYWTLGSGMITNRKLQERWSSTAYFIRHYPLATVGLCIVTFLVLIALLPQVFTRYDPVAIDLANRLMPPSAGHWFGTDAHGRDIYSRVVFGTRISFLTGVVVLASASTIGIIVGMAAGYWGGMVDELLMRGTDVFMAFPMTLLAMLVAFILGPGLVNTSVALIVVWWPSYARLMRSQALTLKERTYVDAAAGLGAKPWQIIFRHILPNALAPLLVQVSMGMGFVVLTAAGLGFLGLGAQPPMAEWGRMISDGRGFFLEAWWYPVFPGIAIAITVLAFNMIGNGLRDWTDPKMNTGE